MDRVILLKTRRNYKNSSSFKVASLFTLLLTIAAITLCVSAYLLIRQSDILVEKNYILVLTVISVVALLLIAIAGYLISVFVVTRINRMADTASEIITTGDLSKRLSIDSRWDDLSFLSAVLNEMLDKIEILMEGVQHITDTVAHDLRTPLARLRNKLEQAENNRNNISTESLIQEVDSILKTFNALLSLSSIESGRQSSKFHTFDLGQVVKDAVSFYTPLAQEKSQTIQLDSQSIQYVGDRDLIFQVVANLIDNSIKFTPVKGVISIEIKEESGVTQFVITDSGPGIEKEAKEKVFDRFYRERNLEHVEGSGLGLSLVKAVLTLHGADIQIENLDPGLKILVTF